MNYDCRTMGERISHRRQTLHIKQNILAEKLNISNNHLSSIENGRVSPSFDLFVQICKELEVSSFVLKEDVNNKEVTITF